MEIQAEAGDTAKEDALFIFEVETHAEAKVEAKVAAEVETKK